MLRIVSGLPHDPCETADDSRSTLRLVDGARLKMGSAHGDGEVQRRALWIRGWAVDAVASARVSVSLDGNPVRRAKLSKRLLERGFRLERRDGDAATMLLVVPPLGNPMPHIGHGRLLRFRIPRDAEISITASDLGSTGGLPIRVE